MNKFHKRWIWGCLLLFLDINIFIDWLPDAIGWIIIAGAFYDGKGEAAAWGKWSAILAAVLSFPLGLQEIAALPERDRPVWLHVVYFTLPFAEFLAYAAFFMISNTLLERRRRSIFSYVFLGFLLVWMLWQHIYMHFPPNDAEDTTLALGLLGFVLMFCFLIGVIKRNNEWKWKIEVEERLRAVDAEKGEAEPDDYSRE